MEFFTRQLLCLFISNKSRVKELKNCKAETLNRATNVICQFSPVHKEGSIFFNFFFYFLAYLKLVWANYVTLACLLGADCIQYSYLLN